MWGIWVYVNLLERVTPFYRYMEDLNKVSYIPKKEYLNLMLMSARPLKVVPNELDLSETLV